MGTGATVGRRIFDKFGKFFLDAFSDAHFSRLCMCMYGCLIVGVVSLYIFRLHILYINFLDKQNVRDVKNLHHI